MLQKAGLPADFWSDDVTLQRYRVRHFDFSPSMEVA